MVPNFLMIGAMKAGTTTLHRDLSNIEQLFLTENKEPETLCRFGNDRQRIVGDYTTLMKAARPGQLRGEASTVYSMRPDHDDVAARALEVCGPDLKIIYIEREPIERIVSQYRHEFAHGLVSEPLNVAVLKHQRYVAYSAYEWQLIPWKEAFGSNILRLSFESYVRNRRATTEQVCKFLGVADVERSPKDYSHALNTSNDRLTLLGSPWQRFILSPLYQRTLKPMIPWSLRRSVAARVLPPARRSTEVLQPEVEMELRERLATWHR